MENKLVKSTLKDILKQSDTSELIHAYSVIIKELKERSVIRSNNLIGDLGEYLAIEYFNSNSNLPNLQAAPTGTQNIDAISRNGERYSIKSTTTTSTGVFYGLEDPDSSTPDKQKFEYVLIVKFNRDFELEKIIQLDWNLFIKYKRWHSRVKAWNLTLTKALTDDAEILFDSIE